MQLKVLSWNIWGGKNREQVIAFLKSTPFDVLALQEVTVREKNGTLENDADVIAQALGYHVSYAKSFRTDRHVPVYDMGNAIISKFPITQSITHSLSDLSTYEKNASTEPRNALQTDISVENTMVHVVSTHLGYSEDLQATPLQLQQVDTLLSAIPSTHTILMGDFNSEPSSKIIKKVEQQLQHTDSNVLTPSWTNMRKDEHPKHRIDYIFVSKDLHTRSFDIKESDASDHLPLFAEIEV